MLRLLKSCYHRKEGAVERMSINGVRAGGPDFAPLDLRFVRMWSGMYSM